ncbi:MAG: hypothetical protein INF43_00350 [Alphaproteobacteria bacterium]|jgi:hypothetical protein|nr:hypothetical protein [Alphaproteobacteria bacterium]
MIKWTLALLTAALVLALTANFFANGGAGFGLPIHPYVYYTVGGLALAIPAFWAAAHLCMGAVMGITGGGLKEGLKLGLMLGVGMALGRSWLNVAAVGAGILAGQGPLLWAIIALGLSALLFALNWAIDYFWHHHEGPAA